MMDYEAYGKIMRQISDLEHAAKARNDWEDENVFWRAIDAMNAVIKLTSERRYTENIIPGLTNF